MERGWLEGCPAISCRPAPSSHPLLERVLDTIDKCPCRWGHCRESHRNLRLPADQRCLVRQGEKASSTPPVTSGASRVFESLYALARVAWYPEAHDNCAVGLCHANANRTLLQNLLIDHEGVGLSMACRTNMMEPQTSRELKLVICAPMC